MIETLILTEGGRDIGFGHITRCISLYQAFEQRGIMPNFIVNGDSAAGRLLKDKRCELFDWLDARDRLRDSLNGADIAIVDSYLADLELYESVSREVKIPVYIDDNKRLDYPRGVILNGTVNADSLGYATGDNMTHLLGSDYIPLRREFWNVGEKLIREDIENVVVTFGGEDSRNITPKALRLLTEGYPGLVKKVVIGGGFKNADEIERLGDKKTEFVYSPEAADMKRVFSECDIAISGGGQTLYELAAIGVPVIAIAAAENQLNNIKRWREEGFIEYAGRWQEKTLSKRISACIENLKDKGSRLKKSSTGRRFVDGRGGLRVCDALVKEYLRRAQ